MFKPKFTLLDKPLQEQILREAIENGAKPTAEKYMTETGMSFIGLYTRLNKYVKENRNEISQMTEAGRPVRKGKEEKKERKLSKKENELLERLGKGTVGIEEMSNLIAVRVFEKMLKNPDDFRFLDFFRIQLVKLKEQESKNKEKWGNELLAKMFAGKLPPSQCPECGHDFMDSPVITGELIDISDESIRPTKSL